MTTKNGNGKVPVFVGKGLAARITACAVKKTEVGKLVHLGVEVNLRPPIMKTMPGYVVQAMQPSSKELGHIALKTPTEPVRIDMKRNGEGAQAKIRIEEGTLKAGATIKFGGANGATPCANIKLEVPYKSDRLRWLADHLYVPIAITMHSAATLQGELPMPDPVKHAGSGIKPIKSRTSNRPTGEAKAKPKKKAASKN